MIKRTLAIPLHSIRYGESSLISHLYSLEFGRIAVLVHGAFGRGRGGGKALLFQPLNPLELVFYQSRAGGLGRLREATLRTPLTTIPYHPLKRAIGLFLGEVIYRTVREEEANPTLHAFLLTAIEALDTIDGGLANFHLMFLVQLSRHLGFYPHGACSPRTPTFDFKSGRFREDRPAHGFCFDPFSSALLSQLQQMGFEGLAGLALTRSQRAIFLEGMLRFYQYHLEGMRPINSLPVLTQVFD